MKDRTDNVYKKRLTRAQRAMILIAAIVTSIAVAVTCALCFNFSSPITVDGVDGAEATTSTNRGTLTGDQSAPGKLNNGDVITYSYTGGVQSITLPIGEFQLVVNGAGGGTGYSSYAAAAGKGGRTTATIKLTAITTLYIVVGGKGSNCPATSKCTTAGGYNGGGTAKSNRTCGHGGGGGGGATHIATATGTLSSLSSNTAAILIVAGGGGGAGNNSATSYYGGAGGGAKTGGTGAIAGGNAGLYANGGNTTVGGTCSGTNPGVAGSFGQGGSSTGKTNYCGGAGGGGGYYGGAGGANPSTCYAYGGGGGSSYVKSTMTNAVYERGVSTNTGNGSATINVINVNQKPTTANPVKTYNTGITRTSGTAVVKASEIAVDPDATKTTLAFTDGITGSLATVTKTTATGLYLNSACTTSANKYLTWRWDSDTQITVTGVKMYPRNGVDGCTLNGRLTLYAKIRDSYANTPSQYEWNTVYFYLTVKPEAVGRVADNTAKEITNTENGENSYYVGLSQTNTVSSTATSLTSSIYNPSHSASAQRYTVNIKMPLQKDIPFVIKAADLLSNVCPNLDMAVMALNSTTQITGSNPKFIIKEYNEQTASVSSTIRPIIYNKSKVQIANAFTQISLVCKTPDPAYQVLSVTLYAVEKNTAYTTEKNVSADIDPITLDIVFKMDNNRPVLINTVAPVVTLDPMKATSVNLSQFYNDADSGSLTSTTHTIRGIKVPLTEYVQLDKYGNVVSTADGSSSYFNILPGSSAATSDTLTDAITTGVMNGEAYKTGFEDWYISSGVSNNAFVQYSYNNMSLSLTGLRATYSMYRTDRDSGKKCIMSGNANDPQVTTGVSVKNAGHFYILINITDKNDTNDAGIWLPLGIIVKDNAPTTTDIERGGAGASQMPTAYGVAGNSKAFYFTPMGITVDRKTYPLGVYFDETTQKYVSSDLQPLASDSDNYLTTNMVNGASAGGSSVGLLNELVQITSNVNDILNSVTGSIETTRKYFDVEFINIYVPAAYFGGRVDLTTVVDKDGNKNTADNIVYVDYNNDGQTIGCVKLKGIKITLKNFTHNRYLFANVGLADSTGAALNGGANIAVNVTNIAPQNSAANNVARIGYTDDGKTVKSEYSYTETGTATVTYSMPVNSTAVITPYDLLWDANLTAEGIVRPASGYELYEDGPDGTTVPVDTSAFTLNGLSGSFSNGLFSVDDKSGVGRTINGIATPNKVTNPYGDFGSNAYKTALKNTIASLNGTRTFNTLSTSNMFGSATESVKTTGVDGLFFARTTDGSNLDAYTFDPYKSDATKFETPSIVGGSYISYAFGNKIRFAENGVYNDANTFNLDYIMITALSRTQVAPVEIELNVRDRMGAGASGAAQGISKIKIIINVINSAPHVQYPDRIYKLTTDPLNESTDSLIDASAAQTITPSTLVIYSAASSNAEDRRKDFLTDNEGDTIMFYTTNPVSVLDASGRANDDRGNSYLGSYLRVNITSETLTITALNSTQNLDTLYVYFYVTDGRSTDGRTLDNSRCYIRVEVLNAMLSANEDEGGFEYDNDSQSYRWTVETVNNSDITRARYFASSDGAVTALTDSDVMGSGVATSGQIKKVSNDTDILQRPILQRKNETQTPRLADLDDPDSMRSAVPVIGFSASDSVIFYIGNDMNSSGDRETYVTDYDILYFVNNTVYSAKALTDVNSYNDAWWNANYSLFFDSEGRWTVGDWAVVVTPKAASTATNYISFRLALRDETYFGGDTAGVNTAFSGGNGKTQVNGLTTIIYSLYIPDMGIVPYTYYNQFNGYYTVTDAQNGNVYVPTYDGDANSVYDKTQNGLSLNGSNQISTSANGVGTLKSRVVDTVDGTLAGIHAGEVFDASKNYDPQSFDISNEGSIVTSNDKEVAFKYSDTIEVSSDTSAYTYVPMSYFAMRRNFTTTATDGKISFTDTTFVSYDLGYLANGAPDSYDLSSTRYLEAITLSDGKEKWTGNGIAQNPYLLFTSYYNTTSDDYLKSLTSPYFNHGLSMPSLNSDGTAISALTIADNQAYNAKNLIGADGRLLYLENQENGLKENTFGIGLKKKNTRASATTLTLTIKVALCEYNSSSKIQCSSDNDEEIAKNSATLTFKIEIGNATIDLANGTSETTGVMTTANGYYTRLDLTTGSNAKSVQLVRKNEKGNIPSSTADVVNILYTDDDAVYNTDGTVNESMSDKAYFYAESLTPMSSSNVAAARAKASSVDASGSLIFTNASQTTSAQNSLRNYFGSRNEHYGFEPASASNEAYKSDSFQPNGGIYGSNMSLNSSSVEGYSSFFRTSISADGSMLTVTPLAKTTLNHEMTDGASNLTEYYNMRGLEYSGSKGYYPLKVLIYDSHGDGPEEGSFTALEIRVYIDGSKPTLSSNLEDDLNGNSGDKRIDVSLPVGSTYQFSLAEVISSNNLLSRRDDGNVSNAWYWEADYVSLKNNTDVNNLTASSNLNNMFRLDTGTYLQSPFSGWSKTTNTELIAGTAKFSDGNLLKNNRMNELPDVSMFMEYDGAALSSNSVPITNTIQITVNRRTTYNSQTYKNFKFVLSFIDNDNNRTNNITVYVEVTNQAPVIRSSVAHENAQELKMRVGDYFTILTTPYDRFLGGEEGMEISPSAQASTSYNIVNNTPRNISQRNLCMVSGDPGFTAQSTQFKSLTTENLNKTNYILHDYTQAGGALQNLGYLAVADDDTPWSLRIDSVVYYDNRCFNVARECDLLPDEGKTSGDLNPLDVVIVASRVCTRMPITITVVDGDGARASFTMYVTVDSAQPIAIGSGDRNHTLSAALTTVKDNYNVDIPGVYETYMTAYTEKGNNVHQNVSVSLDGGATTTTIKNVYGTFTVDINEIAYDPDVDDNNNIAMYSTGADYDTFLLNGMPMSKNGLHYYNDMYDIVINDSNYQSFTIKCLTYNPDSDTDELSFYIRDCGNNIFANAIPITIRLHTLYSSMTNDRQFASNKITPQGQFNANVRDVIDTVNVKSYDDYTGVSAYVKDLEEKEQDLPESEKTKIAGVDSTYQFLNYGNMPASIDQTITDWGINDPDVINNAYNLNYDVRVYALMTMNETDNSKYDPMSLTDAAQLFDISGTQYTNHYMWLRDEAAARREYLVGGLRVGGGTYTSVNKSLLMFINNYVVFEFGADGVSLALRPVTANINTNILLYVEVEKDISSSRNIQTVGAAVKSGAIFYVKVKDSAPIVNTNESILKFSGKINESHIFPIFDETNPYASMFNDSDIEDVVSVNGFIASGNTNNDYAEALRDADCDWQASTGKNRAIEITVNNDDIEANGIPAHSLRVTILRRIDKRGSDGKYASEVTFPLYITGVDKAGQSDTATLEITIVNSDISFNTEKLANEARNYNSYGVGYEVYAPDQVEEGGEPYTYEIDVKVAPNEGAYNVNLVSERWFVDPDFTSMAADTDSYRLIAPVSATNMDKYVLSGALKVTDGKSADSIATITPIFTNDDPYHFVGFSVVADSHTREVTGVAYLRVLDRSGAGELTNAAGITIRINVEVLNAAPTVKPDKKQGTLFTVVGSETKDGTPIVVNASDYVEDVNADDKLYIVGMLPIKTDETDIHCTVDTENGGNIVNVELVDGTLDSLRITPRKGFYGTQDVQITVSDGDLMTDANARTVTFTVTVSITYDINNVIELNRLNSIRSIPKKVTSEMLFKDIVDSYDANLSVGTDNESSGVSQSDEEQNSFNPGKDYVIVGLTTVSPDVTVSLDSDGDWQFVCTREMDDLTFDVSFMRKIDVENNVTDAQTYRRQFSATVGKNHAPTLLENFTRATGYTFYTRESDYGLDGNGTIALTTAMLFSDLDLDLGDRLLFDPKAMSVTSPTMVSLRVSDDQTILYLTFNYRGETDLTIGVADRTGETTKFTIHIKNVDRPEASFMNMIKISVETYPYIWLGVGIGVLVLILFIILLILLLKRRKRKREELESILISELELEEQMLRIANTSNAMYQSFGYLPPTMPQQADPGLMLGGTAAPSNDAIGLNPGGDNGVPNDSDM